MSLSKITDFISYISNKFSAQTSGTSIGTDSGVSIDMSLSKVQSFDDNYRRISFDRRVCDDLSQFILQFLPIKDKFRFQCVSKQFQRTVFEGQHELIITEVCLKGSQTFESIVKKLPHIKSIKCCVELSFKEIDLIIKYCKHLNRFEVSSRDISESFEELFNHKIGFKLTSLSYVYKKPFIQRLANIEEIIESNQEDNHHVHISDMFKLKLKTLKKGFISFSDKEFKAFLVNHNKYFNALIHNNNNSITHLSLIFKIENQLIDLNIGIISELSQLISLELISSHSIGLKSLTNYLKLFSVKCLKLKSLSLGFYKIKHNLNVVKTNNFMIEVKNFAKLRRFDFILSLYSGNSNEFEAYFINSLKTGFENLTHLTIDFKSNELNENLSELLLQNISIYLPKVQKLIIKTQIRVTERTADILGRLSKLEILELNIEGEMSINEFENNLQTKCRKIKSIKFFTL